MFLYPFFSMDISSGAARGSRRRRATLLWAIPAAVVALAVVVLAARWFRALPSTREFLATYPGDSALPSWAPVGFPSWLEWQHFLSALFLLLIFRTGMQMRWGGRPSAFWLRSNAGRIRTANPPVRIGMPLWLHLGVDALWVLNGIVFYVLVFATGQWVRIVPTRWDVFPNAVSAGIQYASLDWPDAHGWTNYNGLQLLTYFITVFLAAPLAILTGLRLAPGFAVRLRRLDRVVPLRVAKPIHWITMVWFVGFTIVHVTLVLATGALRNLDHMYAGRDDESWAGFAVFAASVVGMVVVWVLARPPILNRLAALGGTVRQR